jgi:hypothetical protein
MGKRDAVGKLVQATELAELRSMIRVLMASMPTGPSQYDLEVQARVDARLAQERADDLALESLLASRRVRS